MNRRQFATQTPLAVLAAGLAPGLLARPDSVQPAPGLPLPEMIRTNDINMAVYSRGKGVAVVFCHGFPELAYSWRHQFNAVANAGFRAIAPDLRGFGLTERPDAVEAYAATRICDDLIGMMDTMGLDRAVFAGHDWGGFIIQAMALLYPERCLGLIGVGSPHNFRPAHLPPVSAEVEELVDKVAFNEFLQQPDVPDELLDGNVRGFFTTFMRRNYFSADYLATLPVDSAERRLDLAAMLARTDLPGEPLITGEVLEYYVATFSATGFTGAINWYRAMPATWEELARRKQHWDLTVPYLYIWPEQDPMIRPGHDAGMEDYISDLTRKTIPRAGHSVMEDQPEILSAMIVQWLVDRFAAIV